MSVYLKVSHSQSFSFFQGISTSTEIAKKTVSDDVQALLTQFHGGSSKTEEHKTAKELIGRVQYLAIEAEKLELNTLEIAILMDRIGAFLWKTADLQGAKDYLLRSLTLDLDTSEEIKKLSIAVKSFNLGLVFEELSLLTSFPVKIVPRYIITI